jgi:hypothetical protein
MFSSASFDLHAALVIMAVSACVAFPFLLFRKWKLALVIFSIGSNLGWFLNVLWGSNLFNFYDIVWFSYFSFLIWPLINIALIIWYARTKHR